MSDQAQRLRDLVQSRSQQETSIVPLRATARRGRTLAVTSGKGGVGKTNIVTNLAIALSRRGQKVLVVDADLSLANVDVLLGLEPRYNLSHVIWGQKRLGEIVLEGPQGIKVIPASSGVSELAELGESELGELMTQFSELDPQMDLVLIDTAAGISDNVLSFVLGADEVLLVTTPEPTAYVDAYHMLKTISREEPGKTVYLVVNLAASDTEARQTSEFLCQMADKFLRHTLKPLGWILRDPDVPVSIRHQKPFLEQFPHGLAARGIHGLATALLNAGRDRSDLTGGIASLWKRVVEFLKVERGPNGS